MSVEIALFRGINVGGHGKLPMAELRAILTALGAGSPVTYIQSGNAAYRGSLPPDKIADAVEAARGFRREVLTLPLPDYEGILKANPFPEATETPKALHLFFLFAPSGAAAAEIGAAAGPDERAVLRDRVLWLHAPSGLAGSRLAPRIDRVLGVAATGRNWRTAVAIRDMARGIAGVGGEA